MLKFSKKLFLYNFFTQDKKKKKKIPPPQNLPKKKKKEKKRKKKSFDPKSSDQRQAAKARQKIFPVFVLMISVGVINICRFKFLLLKFNIPKVRACWISHFKTVFITLKTKCGGINFKK